MSPLKITFLLLTLFGSASVMHAQTLPFAPRISSFDSDTDDESKLWKELAPQLPAASKDEDLLTFYVSPIATQNFKIDAKSISIDSDGVIRYTLVAKSHGGSVNISYEGIRCQSFEKKLYAFGHKDGSWSPSRRNEWTPIKDNGPNRQHAALAMDYFCNETTIAATVDEIIERIRWQRPLSSRVIKGNGL